MPLNAFTEQSAAVEERLRVIAPADIQAATIAAGDTYYSETLDTAAIQKVVNDANTATAGTYTTADTFQVTTTGGVVLEYSAISDSAGGIALRRESIAPYGFRQVYTAAQIALLPDSGTFFKPGSEFGVIDGSTIQNFIVGVDGVGSSYNLDESAGGTTSTNTGAGITEPQATSIATALDDARAVVQATIDGVQNTAIAANAAMMAALQDGNWKKITLATVPAVGTIPTQVSGLPAEDREDRDGVQVVAPGWDIYYTFAGDTATEEDRFVRYSGNTYVIPATAFALAPEVPTTAKVEAWLAEPAQANIGVSDYITYTSPLDTAGVTTNNHTWEVASDGSLIHSSNDTGVGVGSEAQRILWDASKKVGYYTVVNEVGNHPDGLSINASYRHNGDSFLRIESVVPNETGYTVALLSDMLSLPDTVNLEKYNKVQILGHTVVGIGAREFYYDPDSTQNLGRALGHRPDNNIGRFLAVDHSVITAEDFGCIGDGVVDDTAAWRGFEARFNGSLEPEYRGAIFEALNLYRLTEPAYLNRVVDTSVQIGRGTVMGSVSSGGILYDGPAGGGPEPENSVPICWIHQCTRSRFPVLNVRANHENGVKPYVAGFAVTGQNDTEYGRMSDVNWTVKDCDYDWIIGLEDRPESTHEFALNGEQKKLRLAGGGKDDCFEGWTIGQMLSNHCLKTHISASASDSTVIANMSLTAANPFGTSPHESVYPNRFILDNIGHLTINSLLVAQNDIGVSISRTNWDLTTGATISAPAHGLSVGDYVYFPSSFAWDSPVQTIDDSHADFAYIYTVLSVTADTLEVGKTAAGPAIDMSGGAGTGTVIKTDETCSLLDWRTDGISVGLYNAEGSRGKVYNKSQGGQGRSETHFGRVSAAPHSYDVNGVSVFTNTSMTVNSGTINGDVVARDITGSYLLGESVGGRPAKLISSSINGTYLRRDSSAVEKVAGEFSRFRNAEGYGGVLINPYIYREGVSELYCNKSIDIPSARIEQTTVAASTLRFADTSIFDVDEYAALLPIGGAEFPALLEPEIPFEIRSITSATNMTLRDFPDGGPYAGLDGNGTALAGVRYGYPCRSVFEIEIKLGAGAALRLEADLDLGGPTSTILGTAVKCKSLCHFTMPQQSQMPFVYRLHQSQERDYCNTDPTVEEQVQTGWVLTRSDTGSNPTHYKLCLVVGQYTSTGDVKQLTGLVRVSGTIGNSHHRDMQPLDAGVEEINIGYRWKY